MTDIYTGTLTDLIQHDDSFSNHTQDFLSNFLGELSDQNGYTHVEVFDPASGSQPADGTDVLVIPDGLGSGPVALTLDNLGDVSIIDGRAADGGINVDLSAENFADDATLPEMRVVLGSDSADVVVGGKADLFVDLGAGNDAVVTGAGDDQIFMGSGDDTIRLGGVGQDIIDGGEGDDTLTLSGAAGDWGHAQNEDGSVTWTNTNTGQTVTASGVEHFDFAADQQSQLDQIEDSDPDDM